MIISNNCIYVLTLSLLAVFINTSRTADVKTSEDLLRNKLQSNDQHRKSRSVGISKQVDQRISDIIAENILHFGHNIGLELAALDPSATRSEIFSPLSLMGALSLLTLGAKGKSYNELKQILGLDSDSELINYPNKYHEEFGLLLDDLQHTNMNSGGVSKRPNANWRFTQIKQGPIRASSRPKGPTEHIIKVANGLFVQNSYTINPDYSQVLQSIYKTEFLKLDFQNRNTEALGSINAWVNRATFGKIPEIIKDEIDKSTKVIIASALYFKAFWQTPFFSGATTEDDFYPDGFQNPPIKVQMMPTGGIFPFYDAKEYDCHIIGLPYKGNETTMYIIQPNNSTRQKLRDLQHVLDAHKINGMIDKMERKTTVMVFPKMHFTRSLHMKSILQTMNVYDVFVNGLSDLSLIGQRPSVAHNSPSSEFAPERVGTERPTVTFQSIYREKPGPQTVPQTASRFGEVSKLPADLASLSLLNLESHREKVEAYRSDLFVDDILHNVNFSVDEQGTEAAAATLTFLYRSGTDVVFRGDSPFLIIIRHDPTKLPLFYGIINKPEL